jgi:hypothetical protein
MVTRRAVAASAAAMVPLGLLVWYLAAGSSSSPHSISGQGAALQSVRRVTGGSGSHPTPVSTGSTTTTTTTGPGATPDDPPEPTTSAPPPTSTTLPVSSTTGSPAPTDTQPVTTTTSGAALPEVAGCNDNTPAVRPIIIDISCATGTFSPASAGDGERHLGDLSWNVWQSTGAQGAGDYFDGGASVPYAVNIALSMPEETSMGYVFTELTISCASPAEPECNPATYSIPMS